MNLNTISLPLVGKATKNRKKPQKSKAMLQRKSSIQLKMLLESFTLIQKTNDEDREIFVHEYPDS